MPGTTGNFTTYLSAPGGVHLYDGINLAALAMLMSKSTTPSVYGPDIIKIGNGVPGATVCYGFAQCAAALKAGKSIRYEGPGGPTNFDSYHDSTGIFQIDTYSPSGQVNVVGNITRRPVAGRPALIRSTPARPVRALAPRPVPAGAPSRTPGADAR